MHERAVGQSERLLGNNGSRSSITVAGIRTVKQHSELTFSVFFRLAGVVNRSTPCRKNILVLDLLASRGGIKLSCQFDEGVPNDLHFHPSRVHPPVPLVLGIYLLRWIGCGKGLPLVGIAGHHETMQVFHAPAGFHPFHGEPIQEFRVGREAAVSAKIKHTLYQGLVKVSHP